MAPRNFVTLIPLKKLTTANKPSALPWEPLNKVPRKSRLGLLDRR